MFTRFRSISFIISPNDRIPMANEEKPDREERRRYHRRGGSMLIPAGVLLGLGIGLLAGYPGPGVLIGLGLGFIGSAVLARQRSGAAGAEGMTGPSPRPRTGLILIGAVLILVGISLVWAPLRWPVIAALFLILLGVWFLFRAVIHR
jgi:hypothetical protein